MQSAEALTEVSQQLTTSGAGNNTAPLSARTHTEHLLHSQVDIVVSICMKNNKRYVSRRWKDTESSSAVYILENVTLK
jgi:hypothetical protein